MAKPANPLDRFTTYTTHFELHAAGSWAELAPLASVDSNLSTTRRNGNGTLLINTRKDAHQNIDNVRFRQLAADSDPTASLAPVGNLTFDVTEPGGVFFAEKILNQAARYKIKSLSSGLMFALKIIFVGRDSSNTIVTIPCPSIIPLQLAEMDARFNYQGGDYKMSFIISTYAAAPSVKTPKAGVSKAAGYVNKNITIKAKTVSEALSQLEEKLNGNYDKTYETELENSVGAKKILYKINNLGGWAGKLSLVTTETWAPGEEMKLTFNPNEDILSMVRKIIHSSKDVNDLIGSSLSGVYKEFQSGVNIPTYTPRYHLQDGTLELAYDINKYVGGGPLYEFDFLFADAGKNVDVLDFEIRFPNMGTWMNSKSQFGTELNTNASSAVPAAKPDFYSNNVCTVDTTRQTIYNTPVEKWAIRAGSGDVAFVSQTPNSERGGHPKIKFDAVPSVRLAFETLSAACGAWNPQQSFTIRGHLSLLDDAIGYPDGSKDTFGTKSGVWIKVNIKDQEGSPFFYTGAYKLMSVDNIFANGKFTQILTVFMMEK